MKLTKSVRIFYKEAYAYCKNNKFSLLVQIYSASKLWHKFIILQQLILDKNPELGRFLMLNAERTEI